MERPALGLGLVERVLRGGYPEAVARASAKRRRAWARQCLDALILPLPLGDGIWAVPMSTLWGA